MTHRIISINIRQMDAVKFTLGYEMLCDNRKKRENVMLCVRMLRFLNQLHRACRQVQTKTTLSISVGERDQLWCNKSIK